MRRGWGKRQATCVLGFCLVFVCTRPLSKQHQQQQQDDKEEELVLVVVVFVDGMA